MRKFDTKSLLVGVVVAIALITSVYAATTSIDVAFDEIKVYVQRKGQEPKLLDNSNILYEDRTYVPLRAVSELFGNEVDYLSETHAAVIGTPTLPAYIDDFVNNPYQQELIEQQRKEAEANAFKPKKVDGIPVAVTELEIQTDDYGKIFFTNHSDYIINHIIFNFVDTRNFDEYGATCFKTMQGETSYSSSIQCIEQYKSDVILSVDDIQFAKLKEITIEYFDTQGNTHYINYDVATQKHTIID